VIEAKLQPSPNSTASITLGKGADGHLILRDINLREATLVIDDPAQTDHPQSNEQ
jgi:hypothetical protein